MKFARGSVVVIIKMTVSYVMSAVIFLLLWK